MSAPSNKLSVPPSFAMSDMLEKPQYSMMVARNYDLLRDIMLQIQIDVVNEDNRDTVGPTILGLKHVLDILLLFQARGNLMINAERREDNRNNTTPNAATTRQPAR